MKIKELLQDNNRRYFKTELNNQKDLIFYIWEWSDEKSVQEIENAFNNAKLPDYIRNKYTLEELNNKPLAIFQLDINKCNVEIKPMNMNLWEYERLFKNNIDAQKSLKLACICEDNEEWYHIIGESFDCESMCNIENMNIVRNYVEGHVKELDEVLNKSFDYIDFWS